MRGSCYGRLLFSTGASVLAMASGLCAQPPASPWAKAVPLPTACYASQDQFAATNAAALQVVSADAAKQKEVNDQISNWGSTAGEDPMATAARMQELMMKDPQNATKLLQQTGATDPEAVQAEHTQQLEKQQAIEAEETALLKRYHAAMETALVPPRTHFAALRKKLGITEGWGVGESGTPDWAFAEYDAIKREADQAYVAMCPQWWGATGAMQAFMKRYKDYLVTERIPSHERNDSRVLATIALRGAPTDSYKSTATLDAVRDYMKLAERLYGERVAEPNCTGNKCRDMAGI